MTSDPETTSRPKRRLWPYSVGAVVAGGLLAWSALVFLKPHEYAGGVLQDPPQAPAMDGLSYSDGTPVDLTAFLGDVTLIYFGFTNCPDLCPTTLAGAARAKEVMGDSGERVHMIMVTVDPSRDTPDLLESYVAHFDPDFRAVWGDEEMVRAVASDYGVYFEYGEADDSGNYDVGHTSVLFALDPAGYTRVVYGVGVDPTALAADLKQLLG